MRGTPASGLDVAADHGVHGRAGQDHVVARAAAHGEGLDLPAKNFAIERLSLLGIPGHELVPPELSGNDLALLSHLFLLAPLGRS